MSTESPPAGTLRADNAALFGALRTRALRIAIVTALLLVATFFILMFMPRVYESSATLLLEKRDETVAVDARTIDALIADQIATIRSPETLQPVIDGENLRAVPEFDVTRDGTSAAIVITVRAGDALQAAAIANAIATTHVERMAGQAPAEIIGGGPELQQQIAEQRVRLAAAEQALADYRQAAPASDPAAEQRIADLKRQLDEAEARRSSAEQRAAAISELLRTGQPVEAVEDVRTSAVVQSLMQSRATLQATLAEKRAILLPAHPTMRSLNAQIAQLNGQINDEAQRVADSLAAQAGIEAGLVASLEQELAQARNASPSQAPDAERDALVREAEAQRALLDALLSQAGGAIQVPFDIRVITPAVPAAIPVSPKGMQVLVAVGVLALAVQIAGVILGVRRSRRDGEVDAEDESSDAADDLVASIVAEVEADMVELPEIPERTEPALTIVPPEPVLEPEPVAEAVPDDAFEMLAADLALGRARILLIAGIAEGRDAALVADALVNEALDKGLSVCRVDAGSGRPSSVPGLTDLCADEASFGDVVHKVRDGLAEVPWGQVALLDRRSSKPVTLVEALSDIYEVVVVSTGGIGLNTSLPIFAGVPCRLVLARQELVPRSLADAVMADAASIGFTSVESVLVPEPRAAVA